MARSGSILALFTLATAAIACGGTSSPGGAGPGAGGQAGKPGKDMPGTAGTMGPGRGMTATGGATGSTGTGGATGTTGPGGMKPGKGGTGGMIVIGIPTPGSPGTTFPGAGSSGTTPLSPGCTPGSAHECPSASGACATSSTSHPTGTTSGSICFDGPITTTTTTTTSSHAATIEYLHETAGGQEYYRFRITFDPAFVDNTYGTNAIGWPQKGHTFKDLVGSDHAELSLFDGALGLVSMFDIDYITANAASACLYGALGVTGGEGKMLVGDAKYVLASTSSLDRNLNGCGYCASPACGGDCTVDSPLTDASYTPNPATPNWDYRVVYEVWIDAAVFGSAGFGGASISFVHASPSKASSNTVSVTPKPCGGCPPGNVGVMTSEGIVCKPVCPDGSYAVVTSEGTTCMTGCPPDMRPVITSEGPTCVTGCPEGQQPVMTSEGVTCMNVCPDGSMPLVTSEGTTCPTSSGTGGALGSSGTGGAGGSTGVVIE